MNVPAISRFSLLGKTLRWLCVCIFILIEDVLQEFIPYDDSWHMELLASVKFSSEVEPT